MDTIATTLLPEVIKKFWDNVVKGEKDDDCWAWIGTKNPGGALLLWIRNTAHNAKKISLQIHNKSTTSNRYGSTCKNTGCVNPEHVVCGDIARFWSYVNKTENGCWLWTGHTGGFDDDYQYGVIHIRIGINRTIYTHIYSYELHSGKTVPDGLFVCHTCDTPLCVNPNHLFSGTALDNNRDRHNKGRDAMGEGHGRAKLTDTKVIEIRKRYSKGESFAALSRAFDVSDNQISCVVNRKNWKHVP